MPQQRRDILGVIPPIQHPLPGAGEAQQAAPDVELFEEEALHVVRLHAQSISAPAAGKMSVTLAPSLLGDVREWLCWKWLLSSAVPRQGPHSHHVLAPK